MIRTRLALMFGLQMAAFSAWVVPLATYLTDDPAAGGLGLSAAHASAIYSALAAGAVVSPFLVGLIADRYFAAQRVLSALTALAGLLLFGAAWSCRRAHELIDQGQSAGPAFAELLAWVALHAVLFQPTHNLCTVISLRSLPDPARQYGPVRGIGTLGWVLAGCFVGFVVAPLAPPGWFMAATFALSGVLLLGMALLSLWLPHTPPAEVQPRSLAERMGLPAVRMLGDRHFFVFFVCLVVSTGVQAFATLFVNRFLKECSVPYPTALQTLNQSAEVALLLGLGWLVARLGLRGLMLVGLAAWALRYAAFATMSVPLVLVCLPLHGVSYVCFVVAGSLYVDRVAPPNLRASAQGLMTMFTQGLGVFGGNYLAAALVPVDASGWPWFWLPPALVAAALTVLLAVGFRELPEPAETGRAARVNGLS